MAATHQMMTTKWRLMAVAAKQFLIHFFFIFVVTGLAFSHRFAARITWSCTTKNKRNEGTYYFLFPFFLGPRQRETLHFVVAFGQSWP